MKQRLLTRIRAVKRPLTTLLCINLLALFLLSCQKEEQIEDTGPPPDTPTARTTAKNLLHNFPPQSRRLIYNLLNATEKSDLWYYHIANAIPQINATQEQRAYLERLLPQLTPGFFAQSPQDSHHATNISVESNKLFTREQFTYLFHSLDASYVDFLTRYNQQDDEKLPEGGAAKSCGCSKESDFCSGIMACQSANCESTSSGCGFLWQYECNGTCRQ